jgi:hypothetical protein
MRRLFRPFAQDDQSLLAHGGFLHQLLNPTSPSRLDAI